jgi:hypothetical protein
MGLSNSALSAEERRALELLAASPEGATEALLVTHGFTSKVITELLDAGLAIATTEPMIGERTINVTRARITDAGRAALER